jgi:outer membrane lipoprotein-sorting protein
MKNRIFLVALVLLCYNGNVIAQVDANDLLKKMDRAASNIVDKSSNIEMIMVNLSTNKEKIKKAVIIQKDGDKKLFRYTYPKSDVGIATLLLPNGELYIYLPLFKKPKKITNLAESRLNNSDFSVKDMANMTYSEKYNARIHQTREMTYILDLNSINSDLEYNHLVVYLNKKFFYPEKMEFYSNISGNIEKISTTKYKMIDGYWVANEVTMRNIKKSHQTTIIMTNIMINQGLKDEEFTLEKLAPLSNEKD